MDAKEARAEEAVLGPGAGPVRGRVRGRTVACLVVALAAHVALAWLAREPGILTREDDAEYIMLAQSLREGGYRDTFREDAPVHSQYPPVYPAVLAAWGAAFGDGFDSLTALTVLLSAVMLVAIFVVLRAVIGENLALLAVVALAVNPLVIRFAGAVLSEIPYTLLSVATLGLLLRGGEGGSRMVAAGAVAILAALTRSVGVTLLAALFLYWLLERRPRAAFIFALASALLVGSWLLWTLLAPEQYIGASYVADLTAAQGAGYAKSVYWRIPDNIAYYARSGVPWAMAVPTVPGTPIDNVLWLVLLIVTGAAGLVVFARRWRVGLLYALAYGGLLAFWVWRSERFLVPALFLLVALVLSGAFLLGSRLGRRWGLAFSIALTALLAAGGGVRTAALVGQRWGCGTDTDGLPEPACVQPDQASFFEAARWIRSNTEPDAVILAAKGSPLWFYTGRRMVGFRAALAREPTEFLAYLRERGADYILLGSLQFYELGDLADLVEANCAELTVAEAFPARTWLFAILPPPTEDGARRSCEAAAEHRNLNQSHHLEAGD